MRRSVLRVRHGSAGYLQRCNFQPGVAAGLFRMALDDAGNQEGIDDPPDAGNDQGEQGETTDQCDDQLGNRRAGFPQVEAVCAETAQEEPQKIGGAGGFLGVGNFLLHEHFRL